MVSGWFLVVAFVVGAIAGAAGAVWGLGSWAPRSRAATPAQTAPSTRPQPSEGAGDTLGIDVQGALRDLEERYRGRTADEMDPPKRKRRQ